MQRGRTGEIDAQRRLAHGGAPCHDHHLAGLQALGHVVDIAETRRHAGFQVAVLQLVELFERIVHHRADGLVVLLDASGTHLVDLGLREVHHVFGLRAFRRVAELRDLGAGRDHVAQYRPLMHDLGIVRGVCGGRHERDERVQIVGAAHLVEVSVLHQLVGDDHHIDVLRVREQVDDRLVYRLVLRLVEVGDVDHLADLADGVLAQQHAAEHRHLRLVVVRRHAVEHGVTPRRPRVALHIRAT